MKNLYAILLVLFTVVTHAQIVNIPDPVFKQRLLDYSPPIDTNADGEIQQSEALAVTYLSLYHCNVENVIGLEAFTNLETLGFSSYCYVATPVTLSTLTNLKSLNFHKSGMPSVDLAGLTNLENLSLGYAAINFINFDAPINLRTLSYYNGSIVNSPLDLSPFTNLVSFSTFHTGGIGGINLTGLTQLESFRCRSNNSLTELDLSDLVNLKHFELTGGNLSQINFENNILLEELTCFTNLTSLDVSNLTLLTKLHCDANSLTSLDLSSNINLRALSCSDNQLTGIDLSNLHKLTQINVGDNLFTSLDFSGQTQSFPDEDMPRYVFQNCPNLTHVNIKNGKPDGIDFSGYNCPNLTYICVDDTEMQSMSEALFYNQITNIQLNNYCNFVPGGSYNTITGTIALYNEGCGNGTPYPMAGIKVNINDGSDSGVAYTDENGQYHFYTQSGDFTITPEMTNPLFGVNPQNATVSFADNLDHTESRDFCIAAVGAVENLEISLIPGIPARPGFDAQYQLVYRNTGNQAMSGSVSLAYDDSVLDLVQTSPAYNTQSIGNLSWDYTNLLPFESGSIMLTFNVNSPMETPAVNIGDVLHFEATIYPAVAGTHNAILDQVVVGSYDPNDKICLEGNNIHPENIGGYLNYVIRFQNSGTYETENVVVRDVIDTTMFDIATLQLTASSHPHITRISGNKVEFIFEGIHLPAEQDNEPESHGFIAFKIKTKDDLTVGSSVSNKADIFFDYNFPITTEPATSVFELLSRDQFEDTSVALYPNPVKDIVAISAKDNIKAVLLYDMMGRLIESNLQNSNTVRFDLSQKPSGIYFIKIITEKGTKTEKIIKQ